MEHGSRCEIPATPDGAKAADFCRIVGWHFAVRTRSGQEGSTLTTRMKVRKKFSMKVDTGQPDIVTVQREYSVAVRLGVRP